MGIIARMSSSCEAGSELSTPTLARWFTTPLGSYLRAREQVWFDDVVADLFGFYAVQIGLPEVPLLRNSRIPHCFSLDAEEPAQLAADPLFLPFAENALDLVVLPHTLEFSDDPHRLLREVHRVMRAEGQVLIAGFNPFSLWGAKRYFGRAQTPPWNGNFLGLYRLKDWLSLLGFEITAGRLDCYAPPFKQESWVRRCSFMEKAGDRWWPIGGGVYYLRATKRVLGMRVITPQWQPRSKRKKAMVPAARSYRVSQ